MVLLPVADALQQVLAHASPLPAERVPLTEAYRRVLAEDVHATRTQPPADVSAMDGYAVRAEDVTSVPTDLRVIGEVAAGRRFSGQVRPGQAVRIFTGGEIPAGADTIVVQENTRREGDNVIVTTVPQKGRHIRPAGLDFREREALLSRGRRLSGRDLGLAAAMNHPILPVYRRPRVALLATGDELVPPGRHPGPGQIVYSNGYSVASLARQEGAEVTDLGIVGDTVSETVSAIQNARMRKVDVLVTMGGASVGDYDLVQRALTTEGMELSFWKIAMRPGRPLMHGRIGAIQVLGLPGNPVSAYVCALLFLAPLLRRLSGQPDVENATEHALLGADLPENDERADYLRARLSRSSRGALVATPFPLQDSSMTRVLADADCLLVREPHAPKAPAGSACVILKLPL
ncbi:MAG: gephyrin-like molybdotransferase Glp [Pseudorhodoplanes sp.]|uniref:molybdopterin molybdotransferase MoeA n=1 Tax=Pseudorhodoplanes sp. TaxID=1934341 RepID=UPI003D15032F